VTTRFGGGTSHAVESPSPLRVAVISKYSLIRVGLAQLVHAASDRAIVVDTSSQDGHLQHVDVVLYDLAGLAADENVNDLKHLLRGKIPVVGLARDGREHLDEGAKALGVATILPERVTAPELITHLERVTGRIPSRRAPERPSLERVLTEREREILRLIGTGMTNGQIAEHLFLSINSVKTYVRSGYKKIGVGTRSEAVLWSVRHGLVLVKQTDDAPAPSTPPDDPAIG
jgi:DNA-binding NarL/FixJ family response regulator